METPLEDVHQDDLPFAIGLVPHTFPKLEDMRLWVVDLGGNSRT